MDDLRLNPIAISIGPIDVHWYGIILGLAALAGLMLCIQEGKRFGLPADFFMDLVLFGVPSAIIMARIYYVAFKWEDYRNNLLDVFRIWNGGIAIYGALIGAFLCGIVYIRYKGYSFWRIADICAPGLIIGQLIGRWGNFVNQEAYGGPTTESFLRDTLHLPNWIVTQMNVEGTFHHPTFLYESLWNVAGLILLLILRRQSFVRSGEILLSYFIWYSVGRFYVEGLRTDSLAFQGPDWLASLVNGLWSPMKATFEPGNLDPAYGNIRISQLVAILLVIAAVALWIYRRASGAAAARYSDPILSLKTGLPAGISEKEDKVDSQVVPAAVPPARVIQVEHQTEDEKEKGHDTKDSNHSI